MTNRLLLIQNNLNKHLPIELTNKIIYNYNTLETPSCKAIKQLFNNIYLKRPDMNFDDIIFITPYHMCTCNQTIYKIWAEYGLWWRFTISICPIHF